MSALGGAALVLVAVRAGLMRMDRWDKVRLGWRVAAYGVTFVSAFLVVAKWAGERLSDRLSRYQGREQRAESNAAGELGEKYEKLAPFIAEQVPPDTAKRIRTAIRRVCDSSYTFQPSDDPHLWAINRALGVAGFDIYVRQGLLLALTKGILASKTD